jgi:signal peptidase I
VRRYRPTVRNPIDRLTAGLPRWARSTVEWAITVVLAVVAVLVVKVEVANPYRIPSPSMEPTLHCAKPVDGCQGRFSDRVIANRFIYRFRDPKRGEIVVFDTPPAAIACGETGTFVKRIIGLPGEVVSERSGMVYVNGKALDEPYIDQALRDQRTETWKRVPENSYFVMGDNRASSCDSRVWGTVPRDNLIGPVFLTYWPPNRVGTD